MVSEAATLAVEHRDYHLATLIAQGGWGNPVLTDNIRDQLSEWEGQKVSSRQRQPEVISSSQKL